VIVEPTLALAFLCCAVSLIAIAGLGLTDPKSRRRSRARSGGTRAMRTILGVIAVLPGIWMLWSEEAVGFLIWLGFVVLAGWFVALVLAAIRET
jgi:hypothetical protein